VQRTKLFLFCSAKKKTLIQLNWRKSVWRCEFDKKWCNGSILSLFYNSCLQLILFPVNILGPEAKIGNTDHRSQTTPSYTPEEPAVSRRTGASHTPRTVICVSQNCDDQLQCLGANTKPAQLSGTTRQDPLVIHHRPDKAVCLTTHYMFTRAHARAHAQEVAGDGPPHPPPWLPAHSAYGHFKDRSSEWLRSGICASAVTVRGLAPDPSNLLISEFKRRPRKEQVKCNADHNL
jgi:hypothetical protein